MERLVGRCMLRRKVSMSIIDDIKNAQVRAAENTVLRNLERLGLSPSPKRQGCVCECKTGGPCEHDFSGPVVYTKNSGSVVCRHCGMTAMAHDIASANV